jgi:NTE family protein
VAFVLTGGASHGAVQAGMLEALTDVGIRPDLLVGASVGALNGVAFAADPTPAGASRLSDEWRRAIRSDVFPLLPSRLVLGAIGRRDHLLDNRGLAMLIGRTVSVKRLEATVIPAYVVATDLLTGDPVLLSEGPVLPTLLASTAIPAVFPPIEIGGRLLIDGGVSADTPTLEAESLGATTIYVLPTYGGGPASRPERSALWVGLYAMGQLLGRSGATTIAATRTRCCPRHAAASDSRHQSIRSQPVSSSYRRGRGDNEGMAGGWDGRHLAVVRGQLSASRLDIPLG